MDINKQLNTAIETGKVIFGSNKTIDEVLTAEPKMVILSRNCPPKQRESIKYYCALSETPYVTIKDSSLELGSAIGRSHLISTVCILDEGESTILEVQK